MQALPWPPRPDDLIAAALGAEAEHSTLAFCADVDLVPPQRVGVRAIVGEAVRGPHGVHVPLHWRAESDAFADFDGVLAIEHDDRTTWSMARQPVP